MRETITKLFDLSGHQSTLKREVLAGAVSFFTIVYIIVVNASILSDAGVPYEAGVIATVLSSVVGCLLMAFWSNAPLILVPGMGVNALFSYTLVHSMGLSWQEALAAVFLSGVAFSVIAFTKLSGWLTDAIPQSLKEAITAGIGVLLTFIGLQKGGLIVASPSTFVQLADLRHPNSMVTILTLLVTLVLFARKVRGDFLIAMIVGTVLAAVFGLVDFTPLQHMSVSTQLPASVFAPLSFHSVGKISFWVAVYSLTMVVLFENIGLIHGFLRETPHKWKRALQANALSTMMAGLFGTSPTITAVEGAAGIAAGGRTGLTSLTTAVLFLLSLFFLPVIKLIPNSAIAPVLLVIGGLMIQSIKNIKFDDFTEGFSAIFIVVLIPLTFSITDGIAFGFILYPVLKLLLGKGKEVALPLYVISGMFVLNFLFHAFS
ncbi:MAG: NCS2 family permease [Tumebacillaceae bacterium]